MFFKLFEMPDKKYIYSISSNKNIFDDIKDEDSIFSIDDKNYIHQQIKDSIDFQRDRNKLRFNSTEIMSESDQKQLEKMKGAENFWTFFRKKFPNRCIRNISNPVFNLRKDMLVVSISEYCGGEFGGGGIYIFKRINGKWKSIKTLKDWVS